MDEKELMAEIQRLRTEEDEYRDALLNLRGFFRTEPPKTSSEGVAAWNQLLPNEKTMYEHAAKGTGIPGPGLFFLGYRKKTA
jgi:hypothetical protein